MENEGIYLSLLVNDTKEFKLKAQADSTITLLKEIHSKQLLNHPPATSPLKVDCILCLM